MSHLLALDGSWNCSVEWPPINKLFIQRWLWKECIKINICVIQEWKENGCYKSDCTEIEFWLRILFNIFPCRPSWYKCGFQRRHSCWHHRASGNRRHINCTNLRLQNKRGEVLGAFKESLYTNRRGVSDLYRSCSSPTQVICMNLAK